MTAPYWAALSLSSGLPVDALICTTDTESHQTPEFVWPDFPVALSEAVGARVGDTLFAGLGSAGCAWYALDLMAPAKGWQPRAGLPSPARKGAVCAVANGKIHVFGGSGVPGPAHSLRQFDSIACYDPQADCWTELPSRLPVGLLGASAAAIASSIYLFGGYNKSQFDQFFQEYEPALAEHKPALLFAFMNRTAEEFAWNDHVWKFDTTDHSWHDLGKVPHAPQCGSGISVDGSDVYLANGEIKPGLRTASVKHAALRQGAVNWQAEKDLPPLDGGQEGIAAAFSGKCGIVKILAGGTNFIGARRNYQAGIKYAHQGSSKLWRDEIYILRNDTWECAGRLPRGRATGLTFEVEQGLLLVGGDTQQGQPCLETWLLSFDESTGITIRSSRLK